MFNLKMEVSAVTNDKTGRELVRFTPVATLPGVSMGELRFACFEAWLDEPHTIAPQRQRAHDNAVQTLKAATVNLS